MTHKKAPKQTSIQPPPAGRTVIPGNPTDKEMLTGGPSGKGYFPLKGISILFASWNDSAFCYWDGWVEHSVLNQARETNSPSAMSLNKFRDALPVMYNFCIFLFYSTLFWIIKAEEKKKED